MQLNSGLFVFSILLGSGLVGGFCVSKGSGHYLGLLPTHSAHRGGGRNYGAEGAAGIMAAGGGGSNEQVKMAGGGAGGAGGAGGDEEGAEGGGAGGVEAGGGGPDGEGMTRTFGAGEAGTGDAGNGQAAGGADPGSDAAGGATGAAAAASAEAARAKAFAATAASASSGTEAAAFLAGNTLQRTNPDASPHFTYFASRGWQADGDGHRFVVRVWDRGANRFCEPEPKPTKPGEMLCTPLEVRFGAAGQQADGAMIGVLRTGHDSWAFIIRGNAARFPDHIPSLDSAVEPQAPAAAAARLTASGKAAWTAMQGQALGTARTATGRDIVAFEAGGRLLQVAAHDDVAATAEGVRVALGHWSFDKGLVCEADSPAATRRTCYRPEAYGPTSFRLVPQAAKAAAQRLSLLVEQNSAFKATQD